MPAKNKRQQRLFGMALALERGKMPKSKASKKVKAISKGMTEKKIKEFAKTKHKGLKENRALTFNQFINEDAYIDDEGLLKGLEFTPEEEFEVSAMDHINSIKDFLEDAGAKRVEHSINGGMLEFEFMYRSEAYYLQINLDADEAALARVETRKEIPALYSIFEGSADSLFDLMKAHGLSFLDEY